MSPRGLTGFELERALAIGSHQQDLFPGLSPSESFYFNIRRILQATMRNTQRALRNTGNPRYPRNHKGKEIKGCEIQVDPKHPVVPYAGALNYTFNFQRVRQTLIGGGVEIHQQHTAPQPTLMVWHFPPTGEVGDYALTSLQLLATVQEIKVDGIERLMTTEYGGRALITRPWNIAVAKTSNILHELLENPNDRRHWQISTLFTHPKGKRVWVNEEDDQNVRCARTSDSQYDPRTDSKYPAQSSLDVIWEGTKKADRHIHRRRSKNEEGRWDNDYALTIHFNYLGDPSVITVDDSRMNYQWKTTLNWVYA